MTYTTQMHAARQGMITPEMEIAAKKEGIPAEELRHYIAEGKAVIPANKQHQCLNPECHWFYVENQNQCQSGHFTGLERYRYGAS